ncbi:reticulon-4b isoform X1 [Pseudorasbora parva]|uniref:reticulon-4b isoform X1 n=1 Tax=Pseudorasbora parva TaxID=51549 RepID=UPI00351EFC34
MEEADKISSSAPDEAPQDVAMNEAAAVGPTQTDARGAEDEMPEKTSPPQTPEKTSDTQTPEKTSPPQITEETSASKITEETSSPQTNEVTSPPQTTEKTSDPQKAEVASASKIPEETISQITEETNASKKHEETIIPQITDVTSASKITEETSPPPITEVTNGGPPPITEVNNDSPPPITDVTNGGPPPITDVTSSSEPAEESVAPASEVPVKRTSTEAGVTLTATDPVITEAAVIPEPAEEAGTPAVSEAVTPAAELTPPQAREEPVSSSSEEKHPRILPPSPSREDRTLPPSPSHEPEPPAIAPALFQTHLPSDRWDTPSVASTDLTMDPLELPDSPGFDPDVLSQSDDDFMPELKKSPFQVFSPLSDSLGEADARRSAEVSDSPSPDLVQDAYDGDEESKEIPQEARAERTLSELSAASDDRPTSLPDILKSSPMNPEKVDSGSSEGSPEFSPVHRSVSESPNSPFSGSANNLLGFDSKILLLKEMAEVTEARIAEKAKLEEESKSEPSFVAFDLVKETDGPLKDMGDVEVSSQASVQTANRFECLNFPSGKTLEHWDSESPSADSFSPVLDAVTQKPPSLNVEPDKEPEQSEPDQEQSEPEPSSEEFEFVERPPRGAADEFLETQDILMFPKPSEVLVQEDRSPKLEAQDQSSYHLHSQPSDSAVRGKAGLESDSQELPPTPAIHPPADQPGAGKQEAEGGGGSPVSEVSAATALELLYWRDVRASALVFGSSLFILLSLACCSIISVLSYAALTLLSITLTFRIYKGVLQAVQKSDQGHPFRWVLEKDVSLSRDAVQKHGDAALSRINSVLKELRRLFLVEDLIDSLKLAALLWVFTYIGAWFNGLTLLILGLIGAFSGPLTYEKHQTQIDQFISMVRSQMKDVLGKIQAMVPGAKKKPE